MSLPNDTRANEEVLTARLQINFPSLRSQVALMVRDTTEKLVDEFRQSEGERIREMAREATNECLPEIVQEEVEKALRQAVNEAIGKQYSAFEAMAQAHIDAEVERFRVEAAPVNIRAGIGEARQAALELGWQIEKCGASTELTNAIVMASELTEKLNKLLP
ncbi:MAG: hypothetical protein AAFX93_14050 [Verrucomicrobiota bacterium]